MQEKASTRDRILEATVELLRAGPNPDNITVRQISERAGTPIGAINYHFQSKENLLNLAVGEILNDVAQTWYQPGGHPDLDPLSRLRLLFKETSEVAFRYRDLTQLAVTHELLHGEFGVATLILPLLRQIVGGNMDEMALRLLSVQLVVTTQVAFLRSQEFGRYLGVDLSNPADRNMLVDLVIDQLLDSQMRPGG